MLTKVSLHDNLLCKETENDKVGVLTDTDTGEISKFNTFSQAKVQSVLIKENTMLREKLARMEERLLASAKKRVNKRRDETN